MVDVTLEEDEDADEVLSLLHELATEAVAMRARTPGDPRPETAAPGAPSRVPHRRRRARRRSDGAEDD